MITRRGMLGGLAAIFGATAVGATVQQSEQKQSMPQRTAAILKHMTDLLRKKNEFGKRFRHDRYEFWVDDETMIDILHCTPQWRAWERGESARYGRWQMRFRGCKVRNRLSGSVIPELIGIGDGYSSNTQRVPIYIADGADEMFIEIESLPDFDTMIYQLQAAKAPRSAAR